MTETPRSGPGQMMVWRSVEREGWPLLEGKYIVHTPTADPSIPYIGMGWYDPVEGRWTLIPKVWADAVTHWMPLPELPEN
jgi:hypothetical protein